MGVITEKSAPIGYKCKYLENFTVFISSVMRFGKIYTKPTVINCVSNIATENFPKVENSGTKL